MDRRGLAACATIQSPSAPALKLLCHLLPHVLPRVTSAPTANPHASPANFYSAQMSIFKSIFIHYAITVVPFFPPLYPPPPCTFPPSSIPPLLSSCPWVIHVSSLDSISYTILNLLLSILYLPFMLLNPCTFSPILPSPPPH